MPTPSTEEVELATLERCFRDLVWANLDARRACVDPAPLDQALEGVRAVLEARFPEQCQKLMARLGTHVLRTKDEQALLRPRVINRHHHPGPDALPRPYLYVGRGTPLGNPYTVKEHGEEALSLYRTHLWEKIRVRDKDVLRALASITWDTHLVCSCAPKPCHADIIATAWDWLQRQPWWSTELFG